MGSLLQPRTVHPHTHHTAATYHPPTHPAHTTPQSRFVPSTHPPHTHPTTRTCSVALLGPSTAWPVPAPAAGQHTSSMGSGARTPSSVAAGPLAWPMGAMCRSRVMYVGRSTCEWFGRQAGRQAGRSRVMYAGQAGRQAGRLSVPSKDSEKAPTYQKPKQHQETPSFPSSFPTPIVFMSGSSSSHVICFQDAVLNIHQ